MDQKKENPFCWRRLCLFIEIALGSVPRQVQRDFKVWIKESGIETDLTPHALRHTVGTRLLKKYKNASRVCRDPDTTLGKLVQRYLGHSDVATTLRCYVDVFPEDIEEAAETLAQR